MRRARWALALTLCAGCDDDPPSAVTALDAATPSPDVPLARDVVDVTDAATAVDVPVARDVSVVNPLPPSALRFGAETCLATSPGLTAFAVGDLDGDGLRDVTLEYRQRVTDAGVSNGFGYARNVTGDAGVRFEPRVDRLDAPVGAATFPRLADLDGDGFVDLVRDARWWRNAGRDAAARFDATFARDGVDFVSGTPFVTPDVATLALVDLDGDDRRDLASAQPVSGCSVLLYPNRSGASGVVFGLQETVRVYVRGLTRCSSLAVGDLDGDARPDLVVTSDNPDRGSGEQGFAVLRNLASPGSLRGSSFGAAVLFETTTAGVRRSTSHARLADFDGDGALDLFVLTRDVGAAGPQASIRRTARGAAFTAGMFEAAVALPDGLAADAVFAADLDADGDPDLASFSAGRLVVLVNRGARGAALRGDAFEVGAVPLGDGALAAAFADVDGDGRPDVVYARDAALCVARGLAP